MIFGVTGALNNTLRREIHVMDKKVEKFVLCFINDTSGKRKGLRIYNTKTKKVAEAVLPSDGTYLNLSIRKGRLYPKQCKVSEFPVITADTGATEFYLPSVQGANAWILGKYADGRLKLVSLTGLEKIVSNATALGFHREFKIVGCEEAPEGYLLTPEKGYVLCQDNVEQKKVATKSKTTSKSVGKSTKGKATTSKATTSKSVGKSTKGKATTGKSTTGKSTTGKSTTTTKTVTKKATSKTTGKKTTTKSKTGTTSDEVSQKKKANKTKSTIKSPIAGKTFCISGKVSFPGFREGLQQYILSLGGLVSSEVTKSVDYLITNDPYSLSKKNRQAHKLGCSIITEEYFLAMADIKAEAI